MKTVRAQGLIKCAHSKNQQTYIDILVSESLEKRIDDFKATAPPYCSLLFFESGFHLALLGVQRRNRRCDPQAIPGKLYVC